ncbi:hypothetical protein CIPAW_06G174900 [Carya illinoinensis]|uniref:Uncharacterized protein n=1 Tax=Carya illinoinensis TaxID=32201 RepID=A0A8T1QDK2_CARIL|nr:hypothetical protein CIPAW_06G174900 [Carya illinoinensis]
MPSNAFFSPILSCRFAQVKSGSSTNRMFNYVGICIIQITVLSPRGFSKGTIADTETSFTPDHLYSKRRQPPATSKCRFQNCVTKHLNCPVMKWVTIIKIDNLNKSLLKTVMTNSKHAKGQGIHYLKVHLTWAIFIQELFPFHCSSLLSTQKRIFSFNRVKMIRTP